MIVTLSVGAMTAKSESDFQVRAILMLDAFSVLKKNKTTKEVVYFNDQLRNLMQTKMSKDMRDELDVICENWNFVSFNRQGFFLSVKKFSRHFSYKGMGKVCKRSNPVTFLTVVDKFRKTHEAALGSERR